MRDEDGCAGPMSVYVTTEHFVSKNHQLRLLKPLVDTALSQILIKYCQCFILPPAGRPYRLNSCYGAWCFSFSIPSAVFRCWWIVFILTWRSAGSSVSPSMTRSGIRACSPITRNVSIKADVGRRFLEEVNAQASQKGLLSNDHFSVDGTLFVLAQRE